MRLASVALRLLALEVTVQTLGLSDAARSGRRKRVVSFPKGSTFYYKLLCKVTALPTTTIFAYGAGFKATWELPTGARWEPGPAMRRTARDIAEDAALVYESHGFDGDSCLKKTICDAMEHAKINGGVLGKIFRLLTGSPVGNETFAGGLGACLEYSARCPLQLMGVKSFMKK